MNAIYTKLQRKPRRRAERSSACGAGAAECGVAASGIRLNGGGGPQKIWSDIIWGFLGLQPLEIPQNGQRNVWKSLDRNTLDLEKLAKKLGARLCFAAFAPARRAGLAERGMAPVVNRRIAVIRSSMSPNNRKKIMH
jgi:hypothetical protein